MDTATIQKYEKMAKLLLNDSTRSWVTESINKLENAAELLNGINTDSTQPLVSVLDLNSVLREDISSKFITRDELLENAVDEYDGYFRTPKTID